MRVHVDLSQKAWQAKQASAAICLLLPVSFGQFSEGPCSGPNAKAADDQVLLARELWNTLYRSERLNWLRTVSVIGRKQKSTDKVLNLWNETQVGAGLAGETQAHCTHSA
jgi:hypothetical protein